MSSLLDKCNKLGLKMTEQRKIIDVRSGKVMEFQNDDIEEIQKRVAKELGYELVDHRLELYGVPIKDKK